MPRVPASTVLIVLLGAIGDVTRALPLLSRLRRGYPLARLYWAVEPGSAPLLAHHPALDTVLLFDRPRGAGAFVAFLRAVRALRADVVLDLQRHLKSGVISLASRAPVRVGFDRRNAREGNWLFNTDHVPPMPHFSSKLQQFLAFGEWLGLPETPVEFGLRLTATEEERVEGLLGEVQRPFVAGFVGSSCPARLWFPQRTAAVADTLAEQGFATVLVGGPGDVVYGAETVRAARSGVVDLTGRTSLRDLMGIFERARAAFGPDSGPMHIAAAVGTPTVSLWGATSAERSAPWGNEAGVINGVAECRPCYRKTCPIGRLCMQAITADSVTQRVVQVMRDAGSA